ncbi:cinnamoyl-CoA reductase 1-like [Punica granatum]|uniref:Cinnamoyl-CoA reductase 1-like n=1 Tax=Punica granatum TaxID=22663 RepID=A0A6P8CAR1_PUNGR|nr:cinnamoyl-CoA reductase 1-like [Punica granatum]
MCNLYNQYKNVIAFSNLPPSLFSGKNCIKDESVSLKVLVLSHAEVFQGTLILKTQRKKRFHTQESGGEDSVPNRLRPLVDVRDVAEAVIMAYEKPEAEGRYICVAHAIKTRDLAEKLRRLYPDFTYPKNYSETQHDNKLNSEKLQKLGWTYRPLEETLIDSIESYREAGLLK